MAEVAIAAVAERFEFLMARLASYWDEIPASLEEFEEWDLLEQLRFVVEWPIPTEFLVDLNELRNRGVLNVEQEQRYQDFAAYMAEKQPLLDELLKD